MQREIMRLVTICGAAAASGVAFGQGTVVSGSGATLQENFFRSSASTNDFIDADNDGIAGINNSLFPDQLAADPNVNPNPFLFFHYRITGSGNGIAEFDVFSSIFDQNPADFDTNGDGSLLDLGNVQRADAAIWNRLNLITAAAPKLQLPLGNPNHRGGMPRVPNADNAYRGQLLNVNDPDNGFTIDFAASDVPVAWFAIQGGQTRPLAVPGSSGYGSNPRTAVNKAGQPVNWSNTLRPLTVLNTNQAAPNALTVYEFPLAITPVGAIVNFGVGYSEMLMSDLRHLAGTGRTRRGENLMYNNRDTGSGTHNTFQNGIGLDPSYGVGENIGVQTNSSANDLLGPNYQPGNKGGSGRVEGTVINTRLGIGHTGPERGITSGWLVNGQAEVLGVISDIKGGTVAARPTTENVINGGPDGYNINGPATLSTRGDPRNAAPSLGGWGWRSDVTGESGPTPFVDAQGNPNPAPANPGVSIYINNILRSIEFFIAIPNAPENEFMPAERLAQQFVLNAAPDLVPAVNPSLLTTEQPIPLVANPDLNPAVQTAALNSTTDFLQDPLFEQFNFNIAGVAPRRTANTVYSDAPSRDSNALSNASANGANYVSQGNAAVSYGSILSPRNRVAGDFNGDGLRNVNDAPDMLRAYADRQGGANWVAPNGTGAALDPDGNGTPNFTAAQVMGTSAVIEILGDFNCDGNFDAADIRYWADGLVLTGTQAGPRTSAAGTLDREAGFRAVDDAGNGNFFGTTLANGTYSSGDSRADISGPNAAHTRGFTPIGHDGVVDCNDIEYVVANFGDWTDINQAVDMDLSADMNGDLNINADDAIVIIEEILETQVGDVDFDGDVDADDAAIATANIGTGNGYCEGDVDFDGDVDQADVDFINAQFQCPADFNGDTTPGDIFDLFDFLAALDGGLDFNGDTSPADIFDLFDFLAVLDAGCP